MREIQTEIRRDRIENDNRKNELQSKAQSGLKTSNTSNGETEKNADKSENKQPNQTRDELNTASTRYNEYDPSEQNTVNVSKQFDKEETSTIVYEAERTADLKKEAEAEIGQTLSQTQKAGQKTIQSQVRHDDIKSGVNRDVIKNKAEIGLKTAKCKKAKARVAKAVKAAAAIGLAASEALQGALPSGSDDLSSESAGKVKEEAGEAVNKSLKAVKQLAKNKIRSAEKQKNTFLKKIKAKVKSRIVNSIKNSALGQSVQKNVQSIKRKIRSAKAAAINRIKSTKAAQTVRNAKAKVKRIEKKTVRKVSRIKRKVLKAVDVRRIFSKKHGGLSSKNVKKLRGKITKRKTRTARIKVKIQKTGRAAKKTVKTVGKTAKKTVGTAAKGVSGAAGAVSRVKRYTSGEDTGNNLAGLSRDIAGKGVEISYTAAKKVLRKPVKAVTKKIKKAGTRTVKKAVNKVKDKMIKKSVKTTVKTTQRTVKTSVKAAKATAKVAVKTAKLAAQAIKAAVQATIHAAQAVGHAIAALMATPVGWIILGVVLVVVLIVIIFNMVSGAATAPVSVVSGVGSSLSWLFGGDDDSSGNSNDEIADLYYEFEPVALGAMADARTHYKDKINEISFGERDTLEFNDVSYYPASAADEAVGAYFDSLNYDDYPYLIEMCYIKKLRDERIAQGLSDTDMPEVTLEREDILNFLIEYCYEFDITIIEGQACPTADCQERDTIIWCYDDADCPDVIEEGDTCPGHTETEKYCDNSHIKAVVKFEKKSKDDIENALALTYDEREILELALSILEEELSEAIP